MRKSGRRRMTHEPQERYRLGHKPPDVPHKISGLDGMLMILSWTKSPLVRYARHEGWLAMSRQKR
jgi:hypothetical protein